MFDRFDGDGWLLGYGSAPTRPLALRRAGLSGDDAAEVLDLAAAREFDHPLLRRARAVRLCENGLKYNYATRKNVIRNIRLTYYAICSTVKPR